MVAAPTEGTVTFITGRGTTISKNIRYSDVDNALVTWDSGGGGASGDDYYLAAEDLRLVHMSIDVASVDAAHMRIVVNNTPTEQMIMQNQYLKTLAANASGASPLNIGFNAGTKIKLIGVT